MHNPSTSEETQSFSEWALLKRLGKEIKQHQSWFVIAIILYAPLLGLELAKPLIIGQVVDEGIRLQSTSTVAKWALVFLGCVLLAAVVRFVQMYMLQWMGQSAIRRLRHRLFRKIQGLPMSYFDRMPLGKVMTRVTNDVQSLAELFSSGAVEIVGDILFLCGTAVMLLWVDFSLFLKVLLVAPPLFIGLRYFRNAARASFGKVRAKLAAINANVQEVLNGVRIVQLFNVLRPIRDEFESENAGYMQANRKAIIVDAGVYSYVDALSTIATALVLFFGAREHFDGALELGILVAFIDALSRFFHPIRELSQKYTVIQRAFVSADRVYELEDEPSEFDGLSGQNKSVHFDKTLRFQNVDFAYDVEKPILKDISLEIKAGERIAIVGRTGSGKSTLMKLLQGHYLPQKGTIAFDGVDIKDADLMAWRQLMAIVPQDGYLFEGSFRDNLTFGRSDIDENKLSDYMKLCQSDWVVERHGGLEAQITAGGDNLSAGERQLIALTRALLVEPNLLILDEATASVDIETERRLQKATENALADRTSIVVAHRLNTIRQADRIIVFDDGQIVESGNHDTLIALGGVYANLVEHQQSNFA